MLDEWMSRIQPCMPSRSLPSGCNSRRNSLFSDKPILFISFGSQGAFESWLRVSAYCLVYNLQYAGAIWGRGGRLHCCRQTHCEGSNRTAKGIPTGALVLHKITNALCYRMERLRLCISLCSSNSKLSIEHSVSYKHCSPRDMSSCSLTRFVLQPCCASDHSKSFSTRYQNSSQL